MPGGKKTKVWMLPALSVVMDDSRNHWQICISSCALPIKQMGPWGKTRLLSCCCDGETGQATESVGSERWCEGYTNHLICGVGYVRINRDKYGGSR